MTGFDVVARRLRARRLRRLLLLLGGLVVALVGVALLPQGQHRGGLAVATAERSGRAGPTAVVQGTVAATRTGDRACFSVTGDRGRMLLVLPPGWSADDRLRLRDDAGQSVAQPGAAVTIVGTPGDVGTVPGCAGTGRIWFVTDVRLPSRAG